MLDYKVERSARTIPKEPSTKMKLKKKKEKNKAAAFQRTRLEKFFLYTKQFVYFVITFNSSRKIKLSEDVK